MQTYAYKATATLVSKIGPNYAPTDVPFRGKVSGSWNERDALLHCRLHAKEYLEDVYSLFEVKKLHVAVQNDF